MTLGPKRRKIKTNNNTCELISQLSTSNFKETPKISSMSFFTAIATSNRAVHHLESGDLGSAVSCLSSALKMIKEAITEVLSAVDSKCTSQDSCEGQAVSTEPVFISCKFMLQSSYVFTYASRISTKDLVQGTDTCNTISAIIVYHLALVHHLQAVETEGSLESFTCLQKAVRLYEHSYKLHMNVNGPLDDRRAMGLLNNLAHVNHMLHDETKADKCWQMLLSLILYVREYGAAKDQEESRSEVHGFLTNVSYLMLKESVSSPAA